MYSIEKEAAFETLVMHPEFERYRQHWLVVTGKGMYMLQFALTSLM